MRTPCNLDERRRLTLDEVLRSAARATLGDGGAAGEDERASHFARFVGSDEGTGFGPEDAVSATFTVIVDQLIAKSPSPAVASHLDHPAGESAQ